MGYSEQTKQDVEGDGPVVTHLGVGRTEIIIRGTNEGDLVPLTVGRWMTTLTHIGGEGNAHYQLVIVVIQDESKTSSNEDMMVSCSCVYYNH